MRSKKTLAMLAFIILIFMLTGCAPNNVKYLSEPAGFWAGLWHGLICVITFIISLFSDKVGIYEINNTGGWYDFGFVLGLMIGLGHGKIWHPVKKNISIKCKDDKEWEEIGKKVEEKVKRGIKKWLEEADKGGTGKEDMDWKEIGKKVEEKIKRELKNWADK
jgi:hypothetical protein